MFGKIICHKCNGNGYRKIFEDADCQRQIEIDCKYCNNQGEVDITEEVMMDLSNSNSRRKQ